MDAAVIGGGVIGLSVAWRAARAGLSVAVVDPDPGSGASHFAAGMIAPVGEAEFGEEAVVALNRDSAARYPSFVAELELDAGRSAGYRQTGTLHVAVDADEQTALERQFQYRRQLGLPVERLTSRQTRELEPGLAPSIRGGMLVESDHQVDPRAMVPTLLQACSRLGVQIHRSRGVAARRAGRVDRCRTRRRRAARAHPGWCSPPAAGPALSPVSPQDDIPPVRPVKGQILRLRGAPDLIARTIRGGSVYILPRGDGRVVIGGTVEERGFDTSVTAGAVYELLREARALVPDVARARAGRGVGRAATRIARQHADGR